MMLTTLFNSIWIGGNIKFNFPQEIAKRFKLTTLNTNNSCRQDQVLDECLNLSRWCLEAETKFGLKF